MHTKINSVRYILIFLILIVFNVLLYGQIQQDSSLFELYPCDSIKIPGSFIPEERLFYSEPAYTLHSGKFEITPSLGFSFGDIKSTWLNVNFDYGLTSKLTAGTAVTFTSTSGKSGISELFLKAKYNFGTIFDLYNSYFYGKFRKSLGTAYFEPYTGKLTQFNKTVSEHFDEGSDISLGFLVKSQKSIIFDTEYEHILGLEYSFMSGREYYDFTTEQKNKLTLFLNLVAKLDENMNLGIVNRFSWWFSRGKTFDIVPQVTYKISHGINLMGGLAIPFIGKDVTILLGVRINFFEQSPQDSIIMCERGIQKPVEAPDKKCDVDLSIDFDKYDMKFFITGYYRIGTEKNINEYVELRQNGILRDLNCMESIRKNTNNYNEYISHSKKIQEILDTLNAQTTILFRNFDICSKDYDAIEISIFGFTDPLNYSCRFAENDTINFLSIKGENNSIKKGDKLDNFRLGGLRSYYTGQEFDRIFSANKNYTSLKNKGKIIFKFISVGVSDQKSDFSAQRKIKLEIKSIKK